MARDLPIRVLHVHFLPQLVAASRLAGATCVVTDVLRATTTMIEALAAGAECVVPCLTVDDARQCAARQTAGRVLLGGERQGKRIDGFDLGNSPAEYAAARVAGKTLVMTTTNGTKALLHCREAGRVLVGGLVNVTAVARALTAERGGAPIHVVCAGTDGQITREDVLFAGALVQKVVGADGQLTDWQLNDEAEIARDAWQVVAGTVAEPALALERAFAVSLGGRNLIEIGMGDDLRWAAQVDRHAMVPRFDMQAGAIRVEQPGGQ